MQNVSQSMEVLELRTYRDLQYVRSMEAPLRSLDARLRTADGSLPAKSFQVGAGQRGAAGWRVRMPPERAPSLLEESGRGWGPGDGGKSTPRRGGRRWTVGCFALRARS